MIFTSLLLFFLKKILEIRLNIFKKRKYDALAIKTHPSKSKV
jgi:hypothetical protein